MSPADRDPLAGVTRLVVDGSNLLHAMARGGGSSPGALPAAALIGRLRAVVPPAVRIVLVLDGPPDPGLATHRLAAGVEVRHSGRTSADSRIVELVADHPAGALVVTDDGDLGRAVRATGAGHVRAAWLVARLSRQRLSGPAAGPRRPPGPANLQPGSEPEPGPEAARRWQPGRGGTRKTGNPRRSRRQP